MTLANIVGFFHLVGTKSEGWRDTLIRHVMAAL